MSVRIKHASAAKTPSNAARCAVGTVFLIWYQTMMAIAPSRAKAPVPMKAPTHTHFFMCGRLALNSMLSSTATMTVPSTLSRKQMTNAGVDMSLDLLMLPSSS